jgi:IS1 family transposase
MTTLSTAKRVRVVSALVEGNSVRSTCRMTGVAKGTALRLLADLGAACHDYMDAVMVDLPCERLQCDEIWSFVYAKEKNVPAAKRPKRSIMQPGCGEEQVGSVWTWTAIDADTKLVPSFHVGTRDAWCACEFMTDLAKRLRGRVQLTTDGHKAYLEAVHAGFGLDLDYAMLVKLYGSEPAGEARYSPAKCVGTRMDVKCGNPDPEHVSTSFAERQNLNMRMGMRRFTRLTNAFSKKCDNHEHMLSIYYAFYNFARVHQTLKTTPAVASGVSDHVWKLEELVGLLEAREATAAVEERRVTLR